MKTDVDTCLKDIVDWFLKNRREITVSELEPILLKHCESEAEITKFIDFFKTEAGRLRFKTLLRERVKPSLLPMQEDEERIRVLEPIMGAEWAKRERERVRKREEERREKDTIAIKHFQTPYRELEAWQQSMVDLIIMREKPSLLQEKGNPYGEVETCQIVPPQYYDLLGLLDSVPSSSFLIEPEVKERKIDEILKRLKDGVSTIHESSIFREFLITMAKFHNYSIGNQILIMLQMPAATRVAGFNTWKDLGRYVKKGEKGIAILAPCVPAGQWILGEEKLVVRKTDGMWGIFILPSSALYRGPYKTKSEAEIELEKMGARRLEEEATYFKVVYVFDVSQTEGKPLPEYKVPVLTGAANEELFAKVLAHLQKQGLTVSFESRPDLDPSIKGEYIGMRIWVRPEEPRAQQLKTLLHEASHYYTENVFGIPRADAETIAESAAFVVGAHFGFDTGTRAFPYVALWSREKKVLEKNLITIRKVAVMLIDALE
jgi:hypothetical protein